MWPFKSVKKLKESGLFNNFTDWHSHILPGVDDGIKTMEESLKVLEAYEGLGFKKVWLTPHVMEDYPNETAQLRDNYEELKELWKGDVEIKLASENMLDTLFEERLEKLDFLTIGEEGNHLLVETSYYTPPYGMEEMLEKTRAAGFFPILAHPERYRYMEEKDYAALKEKGILFQTNVLSLVGAYGEMAQKKAEWLLQKDMIDMAGTDVHNLATILNFIEHSPKKKDALERLVAIANLPRLS